MQTQKKETSIDDDRRNGCMNEPDNLLTQTLDAHVDVSVCAANDRCPFNLD